MTLGKAPNIISTIWAGKQHVKWKFTFNNDFMMNRELNLSYINKLYKQVLFNVFSVIRNDIGHVPIYWWVALFVKVG